MQNHFQSSVESLRLETVRIAALIDAKILIYSIDPLFFWNDVDYKTFCIQYREVKSLGDKVDKGPDNEMLNETFSCLPSVRSEDFYFYSVMRPLYYLLLILIPIGICLYVFNYTRLSTLSEKLKSASTKLGTLAFLAKGNSN